MVWLRTFKLITSSLLFLLTLSSPSSVFAEMRNFTGSNGNIIRAEIVDLTSTTVKIRMGNGREFELPYDQFSKDDQSYLSEEYKKRSEVRYTENSNVVITYLKGMKSEKIEAADKATTDYTMSPRIIFENKEVDESYTGVKGTVIVLLKAAKAEKNKKGVQTKATEVLLIEHFTIDLPARKKIEWKATKKIGGGF